MIYGVDAMVIHEKTMLMTLGHRVWGVTTELNASQARVYFLRTMFFDLAPFFPNFDQIEQLSTINLTSKYAIRGK